VCRQNLDTIGARAKHHEENLLQDKLRTWGFRKRLHRGLQSC